MADGRRASFDKPSAQPGGSLVNLFDAIVSRPDWGKGIKPPLPTDMIVERPSLAMFTRVLKELEAKEPALEAARAERLRRSEELRERVSDYLSSLGSGSLR